MGPLPELADIADHQSPNQALSEAVVSFVLGSLREGLGLSTGTFLCIVSLPVWGILS